MAERVVLAPESKYPCYAERDDKGVTLLRGIVGNFVFLSDDEARHLRDLLCEWYGSPQKENGDGE